MKVFKIGLKLWSTNKEYVPCARELFARGEFDYVELFTVSGSLDFLELWQGLKVPYILHAPHSYAGFNPSLSEMEENNRAILKEVDLYCQALAPLQVIFHPGIMGGADESIRQFLSFKSSFPRVFQKAVVENKPAVGLKGETCVGASVEEMRQILKATNFGFCFDFGHAICYANWAQREKSQVFDEFMSLKPDMFHLSDGNNNLIDSHYHLGHGKFDIPALIAMIPDGARVTLEVPKNFPDKLDDVLGDIKELKYYAQDKN